MSYTPRAILLISSRDPRFNRPDVTERLMPLHFARPAYYRTEDEIFRELGNRRSQIMGSLLCRVAEVVDLLQHSETRPVPHRMADFASFGARIASAHGAAGEFLDRLTRLERQQSAFAAENDGLIHAIRVLLDQSGDIRDMPIGDLFRRCEEIARETGLLLPRSVQGFGQRLSAQKRVIELELGVIQTERRGHAGQRFVSLIKKTE